MPPKPVPEGRLQERRWEALAATNPLFGKRRLKLGTFCTNVSGGATMSAMEGVYKLTWDNVLLAAHLADAMEFEAIVPIARWRGFGGATDFNGEVFEPFTFAAAVSAMTKHPSVFATAHVPSLHPVMAAKQSATIDHISRGRFTLNVVTGWNRREIELFGSQLLEHDKRFAVADEWITLMKRLWTEEGPVYFAGAHFQVRDAMLRPHPVQPYPALMNASNSQVGKLFAAKHFDIVFTALATRDPDEISDQVQSLKALARAEFGRDLKVWINAYMLIGDTHKDAQDQFDYCIYERGDWEAADIMLKEMGITTQGKSVELRESRKIHTMAGYGGLQLLGTPAEIVDDMGMLTAAGLDGILLSWPAYIEGMKRFQAQVYPLLIEAGLR